MKLITRSDFDGLCCAVLLREVGLINEYQFVHPKDVQDGKIVVTQNDVLTNIPYVEGCGMWFDHHSSEWKRLGLELKFEGLSMEAPSCARVIWDYYNGHQTFSSHFDSMMEAVDKSDSGNLTMDEIQSPQGWILLSFVMDPRTGLGRYQDYRVSNYSLMESMIEYCRTMTADQILQIEDVQERVRRYFYQNELFQEMLKAKAVQRGNVVLIDLRGQEEIYTGNRFLVYCLFPDCNISLQAMWGLKKQNTVITCGHSVLNRSSKTDVGSLMLELGGGGHRQVGTCQVPNEKADTIIDQLIARMNADG